VLRFIVDIAGKLPVILCELDASDGSLENSYLWADGQILAQYTHNADETVDEKFYYVHDRLGSVRMVIGYDGSDAYVENHYTYSPFGQMLESSENTYNPWQFTGQWYDQETSEYYLRARQYDPTMMRFTTRDPVRGAQEEPLTLHKYLYCVNNSVNSIDPGGLSAGNIMGALIAGTAVHGAAIDTAAYGVSSGDLRWLDLGIMMEHYVAPAMYIGAALGPAMYHVTVQSVGAAVSGLTHLGEISVLAIHAAADTMSVQAGLHFYLAWNLIDAAGQVFGDVRPATTPLGLLTSITLSLGDE